MELLQGLLESSDIPLLTAFLLGLMTAISPCPLATNITAVAYISRDIEKRRKVFSNGLWYTAGRAISYTAIGVLLFLGASRFNIASFLQTYGEKILGPLLIVAGILMLDLVRLNFPGLGKITERMYGRNNTYGAGASLVLGMVFALAFCPYSGVLYFGMLIPLTVASASGLYLPVVFALATGLPVIIVAYLLAFSISSIGNFYERVRVFEKWFRRFVAIVFIATGLFFVYKLFITG